MNCAKARCKRATAPDIITNRLPDILPAVSKSNPSLELSNSKCSFGVKSNFLGVPQRWISTLSCSLLPSGVSSYGKFGMPINRSTKAASFSFACPFRLATSVFFAAIKVRSRLNSAVSPIDLAAPTNFAAAF